MLGGIIDVDRYTSPILLPFFATGVNGINVLEKGTPLVKIILFHRATDPPAGAIRAGDEHQAATHERILCNTIECDGW